YRYVEYNKCHVSSQWSFQINRKLRLVETDDELEDKYLDTLEGLMEALFSNIEASGNNRPAVVVLRVSFTGEFNMSFENEDTNALEIDKLSLGTERSFFKNKEVH
ncbi:hypothetical protein LRP50_25405, partial [Enterovibrio sp. ZSDZ42]